MTIKQAKLLDCLLSEFKYEQPLEGSELVAVIIKVGALDDTRIQTNLDFLTQANMIRTAKEGGYEILPLGQLHIDAGGYTSQVKNDLVNKFCIIVAAVASVIAAGFGLISIIQATH
jgi:hypothetical protein